MRNYSRLDLEPSPGLNVFIGANAQGKSNLLEAICMLGTGKSFRTSKERDVVRSGFQLAVVSGEAALRAGAVRLSCTLDTAQKAARKMYAVNGAGVRYARFLGSLRVVTFVPSDLHLASGAPAVRRAFLNTALAQDQKTYYHDLARYQKAVAQKSALLRAPEEPDQELMAVYDNTMIETGTSLMLARAHFAAELGQAASRMHRRWSSGEVLQVRYRPNIPYEITAPDSVAGAFAARLREVAAQERARGASAAGPHRDDLELLLDDRPLAAFGSQGQQRTAVLALKVAEYGIMQERSGEAPLLLLDDVLSELDPVRAAAFMEGVGEFEQAFLTATHVPPGLSASRMYRVENAQVSAA